MERSLASSVPAAGRIDGWREFRERFLEMLSCATASPGQLLWSDADFGHWPLGERATIDRLQHWVHEHGEASVKMVAAQHEVLARQHPRWLAWRMSWSHRVGCFLASAEIAADLRPMFIWCEGANERAGMRMLDSVSAVGQWSTDPATLMIWRAEFDAYLQRSSEGMPCTTLGL